MTKHETYMGTCPVNRCETCVDGGEPLGFLKLVTCRNRESDHYGHLLSLHHVDCGAWKPDPFKNIGIKTLQFIKKEKDKIKRSLK